MRTTAVVFGRYTVGCAGGRGAASYDPVGDTWEGKPLRTTFSYWDEARRTAAGGFLNENPRVAVIGGYRPGNNQPYLP